MNEYRVICSQYGDDGHQLHRFPKNSEASALQTVIDRNHKAELDARKPERERYIDHGCAPYRVQYRSLMDWSDLT